MGTDKLKTELEKAKQKVAEWQAMVKDIERRITEQENLEIVRAVRSIRVSPDELSDILGQIRSMKEVPGKGSLSKKREAVAGNGEDTGKGGEGTE